MLAIPLPMDHRPIISRLQAAGVIPNVLGCRKILLSALELIFEAIKGPDPKTVPADKIVSDQSRGSCSACLVLPLLPAGPDMHDGDLEVPMAFKKPISRIHHPGLTIRTSRRTDMHADYTLDAPRYAGPSYQHTW